MGSIDVSSCRCWVGVSLVQPVMMRFAVLSMTWSLLYCVGDMIGEYIVFAYSRCGRMSAL